MGTEEAAKKVIAYLGRSSDDNETLIITGFAICVANRESDFLTFTVRFMSLLPSR